MITKQDFIYYLEDLRTLEQEMQDEYNELAGQLRPGPLKSRMAGLARAEQQHVLFVNKMIELVEAECEQG